jgi:hypothetical protein
LAPGRGSYIYVKLFEYILTVEKKRKTKPMSTNTKANIGDNAENGDKDHTIRKGSMAMHVYRNG